MWAFGMVQQRSRLIKLNLINISISSVWSDPSSESSSCSARICLELNLILHVNLLSNDMALFIEFVKLSIPSPPPPVLTPELSSSKSWVVTVDG